MDFSVVQQMKSVVKFPPWALLPTRFVLSITVTVEPAIYGLFSSTGATGLLELEAPSVW